MKFYSSDATGRASPDSLAVRRTSMHFRALQACDGSASCPRRSRCREHRAVVTTGASSPWLFPWPPPSRHYCRRIAIVVVARMLLRTRIHKSAKNSGDDACAGQAAIQRTCPRHGVLAGPSVSPRGVLTEESDILVAPQRSKSSNCSNKDNRLTQPWFWESAWVRISVHLMRRPQHDRLAKPSLRC